MALMNVTLFTGILTLLYLSSFVFFAILRITTGVSIRRIGYFGLQHITYTPKKGLKVDIDRVSLVFHRPTLTQPTWVTLQLRELKFIVDPVLLGNSSHNSKPKTKSIGVARKDLSNARQDGVHGHPIVEARKSSQSKLSRQLDQFKEGSKRVYRRIHLLWMLDITALNTSVDFVGIGNIQVASLMVAVSTHRKVSCAVQSSGREKSSFDPQAAEWILRTKTVLIHVEGNESVEVLDTLNLILRGVLHKDCGSLQDISVAVKVERLHIPLHEISIFMVRTKDALAIAKSASSLAEEFSSMDVDAEPTLPGSRTQSGKKANEMEEEPSFILRSVQEVQLAMFQNVQEIQLAMSFIRISKAITTLPRQTHTHLLNIGIQDFGVDIHRLDQSSPSHRMYFSPADPAHQALVTAVSISVTLDIENNASPLKVVYIPMFTATVRTTLPSKIRTFTKDRDIVERSTNLLFADFVVTSPSVDLEPPSLLRLLTIFQQRAKSPTSSKSVHLRSQLIFGLLPTTSIKLSIHEPVLRFVLPVDDTLNRSKNYNMVVSVISSVSITVKSSHALTGDLYLLTSDLHILSHRAYYQAQSGIKHDIATTKSLEVKFELSAATDVVVLVSGVLISFSALIVREEVSRAICNIVQQFRLKLQPGKLSASSSLESTVFLRKLPIWLQKIRFEIFKCSLKSAGSDISISNRTRGLALYLDNLVAEYSAKQISETRLVPPGLGSSADLCSKDAINQAGHSNSASVEPTELSSDSSDGRKLTILVKSLAGFIIESVDQIEPEAFLSLPRLRIDLSTSHDLQGAIFNIHSTVSLLYLHFSLLRLYSAGIAGCVLRDSFLGTPLPENAAGFQESARTRQRHDVSRKSSTIDFVSLNVVAALVRIKATLPVDPPMLLQIYEVATGYHRQSAPFLRAKSIRLHAKVHPIMRAWAHLLSMHAVFVDLCPSSQSTTAGIVEEDTVNISADSIHLYVPYNLQMFKIFDNTINTAKAATQLQHKLRARNNDYVLKKGPEGPKSISPISIRSKTLTLELEDDPFEWKVGAIYRTGLIENRQRLAQEDIFNAKLKILKEELQPDRSSRFQAQSHQSSYRNGNIENNGRRAKSHDSYTRKTSPYRSRYGQEANKLQYHQDGVCALSNSSSINAQEAWQRLQEHNAYNWKQRIDRVLSFERNATETIRHEGSSDAIDDGERILKIPDRPGLMTMTIDDVHFRVGRPAFELSELPRFLHVVGKGMPLDTEYALLIPMHIRLDMGETSIKLRDYPLKLLHIPAVIAGKHLPSWTLETDLVIAEEFRDEQSIRHIIVDVIPDNQHSPEVSGFTIDVRRTVSPVKTFSKLAIDINTGLPTRVSWGTSYGPVIQDVMMVLEGFTKPEIDPSDGIGFWDKIRLMFHSRISVNWTGGGDFQVLLKGSRDPYNVDGYGAGFVMCWRDDVQWTLHANDDAKRFMTVTSGEYVLAVPDYSDQAQQNRHHQDGNNTMPTRPGERRDSAFKKVIMKVSNVEWTVGLVFERNTDGDDRSFGFAPHYKVILRNPKQMGPNQLQNYDAFRGFRSHYIHLSVGLVAPGNHGWSISNPIASDKYNTIHLTPRVVAHFLDWWSLFSGNMSLPVRQGRLWRSPKKNIKFGSFLSSIKYKLLLSPLALTHLYKHKDAEDYQKDEFSTTGLKFRMESFMLDLHQRREYFNTLPGGAKETRTSSMKINEAELDFVSADLRALSARFAGITAKKLLQASDRQLLSHISPGTDLHSSHFTIPDNDLSWVDMNDFVELDWILLAESTPETEILPLAYIPRFTYLRQTDHNSVTKKKETYGFGENQTHVCHMLNHNDPRDIQTNLVKARTEAVQIQLEEQIRMIRELELQIIEEGDGKKALKERRDSLKGQEAELQRQRKALEHKLLQSALRRDPVDLNGNQQAPQNKDATQDDDFISDFDNRFLIHNAQFKWNSPLRDIILRYFHQVSQRRGLVYYASRRAIKFILDIVDEQSKLKEGLSQGYAEANKASATPASNPLSEEGDQIFEATTYMKQILEDARRFTDKHDPKDTESPGRRPSLVEVGAELGDRFLALNSYHARAIAPQIQLQSEQNKKAVVVISAKNMQLKIISVMDKARILDDVGSLVQRRFKLDMDSAQFFLITRKDFSNFRHLYPKHTYGNTLGSSWPPWVSLEVMFNSHLIPFGFHRIIKETSASLTYEKYNSLRLKFNEEVGSEDQRELDHSSSTERQARGEDRRGLDHSQKPERRMDSLQADFPRIRAYCDSTQFYAMKVIVLDLLLNGESLGKSRSERLERTMLTSDFSDLRSALGICINLQKRIHQLEEIKLYFTINAMELDQLGWQSRIDVEKDLATCEDELFVLMEAITLSQQKNKNRESFQSREILRWRLSASDIVWHLTQNDSHPLLEIRLGNAVYHRTDNSDGSNDNVMKIDRLQGLNLLPTAAYSEFVGPYHDEDHKSVITIGSKNLLYLHWYLLKAVAGIKVIKDFQVSMSPLKVQLERELAKKLFEYIFPGVGSTSFESGDASLSAVEDEDVGFEQAQSTPSHEQVIISHEDLNSVHSGKTGRSLQPTFNSNDSQLSISSASKVLQKPEGLEPSPEHHRFRLFRHSTKNKPSLLSRKQASNQDLHAIHVRPVDQKKKENLTTSLASDHAQEKENSDVLTSAKKTRHLLKWHKMERPLEDLTQMIFRASNYRVLTHVRLDSFVVCLSYKGSNAHNIEDLQDLVFKTPILEYRNKTWSNLDLMLRLKKDIVRGLLSQTGAVLGNKLSLRRSHKQHQLKRAREVGSDTAIIPITETQADTSDSDTTSLHDAISSDRNEHSSPASLESPPPDT